MQKRLLFLLLLLWGTSLSLSAQKSEIMGSMPKDGASDLLRNVIISVGLQFANDQVGFDPQTINPQNIRLYPANAPLQLVESFVIADENNHLLLVEPSQLLAPNTQYIFEISSGLRDNQGSVIGPYKIQFSTGANAIPKRISTQRPKVVHQAKKVYLKPGTAIFADPVISVPENSSSQYANEETVLPAENEKTGIETSIVKEEPIVQPAVTIAQETTMEPAVITANITFQETLINANSSLPVLFEIPENCDIQYIIKNTSGEVVKKGSGKLYVGKHLKSLAMGDLPPGRYQILIKAGELRQKQVFEIR